MRIRRDYSYRLYGRRRPYSRIGLVLLTGIFVVAVLILVSLQFDELQTTALSMVGAAPEPTAFASDLAMSGSLKFREGDLEGALRDFRQAVAQQPGNIAYQYELGMTLNELGQTNEAVEVADQMITAAPVDVRGYAIKANALMWSNPADAIIVALQGEEINPDFAPIHSAMAVANTNIFRFAEALTRGQRAIDLDPMDPNTYRAYSNPLIYLGRTGEAIEALETAVSLNPSLPNPYFELGAQYRRIDDHKAAVDIYWHIIENLNLNTADQAKAYLRICQTLATRDEAEFDQAEPYCLEAIDILPTYGSAYKELGRMQYNRRNYEGSIESFQTCARFQTEGFGVPVTDPSFPGFVDIECWALRGLAHYWMAQCDDGWQVLNEALQIADRQSTQEQIVDQINTGLFNITQRCTDYSSIPTPTPILPTQIPPTPIGSL